MIKNNIAFVLYKKGAKMIRRNFIKNTGFTLIGLLINDTLLATGSFHEKANIIVYPHQVSAVINNRKIQLSGSGNKWSYQDVEVTLNKSKIGLSVTIAAPAIKLSAVTLEWQTPVKNNSKVLNDHWERTYGDISWHSLSETETIPWYFLEVNEKETLGFGVKTGTKSFCSWQVGKGKIGLNLDTRSGGNGVQLGERKLLAAEIVTIKNIAGETPFQTGKRFMSVMCDSIRTTQQPVYGINDWYFSYGNNSEKLIIEHTEMMAPLAEGLSNRPFSVIDAGWFQDSPFYKNNCCWGDNMHTPNKKFTDMSMLASKIKTIGMRPGIWTRPLCGSYKDSKNVLLPFSSGKEAHKPVLDPSILENLERVKDYFKLYNQWGYELIKFDFTSFDIFGRWGFEMLKNNAITEENWSMYDTSKTNAEIVLNLYQSIREAAGETYIIGCNTFSHLAAGLFELNRIGDDTSGNEWERTLKMGVNTLAFRGIQHGTFYAADADCVGLTSKVSWKKNKQWMELVAKSGTPLFISAQSEATGEDQKKTIRECFAIASQKLSIGEPLDWMGNPFPKKWLLNGKVETFDW